jgi:hypothetical protein
VRVAAEEVAQAVGVHDGLLQGLAQQLHPADHPLLRHDESAAGAVARRVRRVRLPPLPPQHRPHRELGGEPLHALHLQGGQPRGGGPARLLALLQQDALGDPGPLYQHHIKHNDAGRAALGVLLRAELPAFQEF